MKKNYLLLCLGLLLPSISWAATFPDTPLQTASTRPAANILFILDDSGSMAFDYMPDTLASGDFNRLNVNINPLAYDSKRNYYTWRDSSGNLMTGGTSYTAAYSNNSLLSGSVNLRSSEKVFYYPINTSIAFGNTTKSNYYAYTISYSSSKYSVTRCEYKSGNTWDRNCRTNDDVLPSKRTLTNELVNYATWHSYHRTRMKVAKAGALEAFSQLQDNVRVGYNSIWNRDTYNIPVGTDGGLFRGSNKNDIFTKILNANGSGGTPLHGALDRAGQYFSRTDSSGPWGPQSGVEQYSCRQNFSILTTDGYWNNDTGFTSTIGNSDNTKGETISGMNGETYTYNPSRPYMDTGTDTLADIAMHYWKKDLRPNLDNNVPASVEDPAFWQHMVTFGISIGIEGTLDPNQDLNSLRNGSLAWPDPWRLTNSGSRSWNNEGPRRIDDLWHATVNGRGTYSVATDPEGFTRGMKDALASIQKMLASGSNVSTSSTSLQTDTRIFHATYYSGLWTGELSAFDISSSGLAQDPSWRASQKISKPYTSRKIFTSNSTGNGVVFPTTEQGSAMAAGLATRGMVATATEIGNYVKGDTSKEINNGGSFRSRESLLGDIVNSSPAYSLDTDTIYVGSNDGMLHGYNAMSGAELFSYVPKGLSFANLGTLPHPEYTHKYFVDGQVLTTSRNQTPSKNYLVGALGRGGKGLFGLDITTPNSFSASSVLWDKSADIDNDMGHILGELLFAKTNDNENVVIAPNGIDSTSGEAVLYVIRISDGTVIKKIKTGVAGGNGLSAPRGWDENGDGKVDYVYAGDFRGNLWRFDLSGSSASSWKIAYSGQPMFKARSQSGVEQPITGGLSLAREAYGNRVWVLFGTGRYIELDDITNENMQTVYGVIVGNDEVARADLQERGIKILGTGANGNSIRSFEEPTSLPGDKKGWALDLNRPYTGERVIERGYISGRIFVFPSVVPTSGNACEYSGKGFINAIDPFTGTSVSIDGVPHAYFDVGQDQNKDNDWLKNPGNSSVPKLPVGSVETNIGMVTKPVLVGEQLVYGGSSGGKESQKINIPPLSARRLNWRELIHD